MKPLPKAVVFDVDGVLVQSMERHYEAYREIFAEVGVKIEPREVFEREGKKAPEVVGGIAHARNLGFDEEQIRRMAKRKQERFYSQGPAPLYPGAREFLEDLRRRGIRIGLASGTWRANVSQHLGALVSYFDATVSADEVARTKPDPEPYLKAMEMIGVAAADTVVVENAPLGIRAGKAAGARVVAVETTLPAEDLLPCHPDLIVPDIVAAHRAVVEGRV
jgi:beta-phosphoglucomutase